MNIEWQLIQPATMDESIELDTPKAEGRRAYSTIEEVIEKAKDYPLEAKNSGWRIAADADRKMLSDAILNTIANGPMQ